MTVYKILIVDDEINILNSLKRVLRNPNYELLLKTSAQEALTILRANDIALILSDHKMPEMDGNEFIRKAQEINKDVVSIVLTGTSNSNAVISYINTTKVHKYLMKPWIDSEIRDAVHSGLQHYKKKQEIKEFSKLVEAENNELVELNVDLERRVYSRSKRLKDLNSSLEGTLSSIVEMLIKMVGMNSNTIAKHSKRVGSLTKSFGRNLELNSLELFELELAANLHDIGKIGLPDWLLKKDPQTLSGSQKLLFESHCSRGQIILSQIGYFKNVSQIVMQHHERWDGKGYPKALTGNEICRSSQILQIVDHFDKFMNGKNGFEKNSVEDGIKHLESKAGSVFDPVLVQEFRKYLSQNIYSTDVEVEVSLPELHPGMTISRGIHTSNNVLLLPTETVISEDHITKLNKYQEVDPIVGGLYIYRKIRYSLDEGTEGLKKRA